MNSPQKFILLSMTLPDCVWAEKSGPARKAAVKQLCAACSRPHVDPVVNEGTQPLPLAALRGLTHSAQGSLPSSCHTPTASEATAATIFTFQWGTEV